MPPQKARGWNLVRADNGFGFAEHQSIAGDLGVVAIGYFPPDLKMFSFLIIIFALIHCCFLLQNQIRWKLWLVGILSISYYWILFYIIYRYMVGKSKGRTPEDIIKNLEYKLDKHKDNTPEKEKNNPQTLWCLWICSITWNGAATCRLRATR